MTEENCNATSTRTTVWILNSAVLAAGGYGTYRYEPASREQLAEAMRGPHESRIGYPETADVIERWTGVRPWLSRALSELAPGDVAYVVRLRYRVADPSRKGERLVIEDDAWELGRLERLT